MVSCWLKRTENLFFSIRNDNEMRRIKDLHEQHTLDIPYLERRMAAMAVAANVSQFGWVVVLTYEEHMQELNNTFRKKDAPTDVLSFPYYPEMSANPGVIPPIADKEDMELGDIIICLEVAERDARERRWTLEEHILMLIAHGLAHLLGYDHETEEQYYVMHRFERILHRAIKLNIDYTNNDSIRRDKFEESLLDKIDRLPY